MKLPEIIKKAVLDQDWMLVCKVYTAITGEPLSPPPPPEIDYLNMDISEDLLEQIGNSLEDNAPPPESEPEQEQPSKKKVIIVEDFSIDREERRMLNDEGKVQARKEPIRIQPRKNLFADDLSVEAADLKANNPKLKELYAKTEGKSYKNLVDRADTTNMIQVECALCHKKEEISSRLARGYNKDPKQNTYRCTTCCTPSGQGKALRLQRQRENR